MKKLFFFSLVVSAGTCLQAQQAMPGSTASATPAATPHAPPTLPPGPLLKPVPDNCRWTLTTTSAQSGTATPAPGASPAQGSEAGKPGEKEKAKAPITTVTGEKMGKMAHLLTVRSDGGREEKWTDGTLLAILSAGTKGVVYTTGSIGGMPVPSWISRENVTDIKQQGAKSYFIFQARIMPTGTEIIRDLEAEAQGKTQNTERLKVDATAVIDGDTRLPVAVKEGETTATYKFEPLAPDAEIVPAATQAALAEREKKIRDAVRKPIQP